MPIPSDKRPIHDSVSLHLGWLARPLIRLIFAIALPICSFAADRPNFLWILSEDSSKHYFRLFDETGVVTPNIERLAHHGLIFDRAFSNSPVCSVARTTLLTGCYAPRVATQFHRKEKLAKLPPGWRMFPAYLRDSGYYTSNNAKKDYNAVEESVWDISSPRATWRNRPPNAPFFHMQTFTVSHEGSLHFSEEQLETLELQTDPDEITLPPYHPHTPLFRKTHAAYHDRIRALDQAVGKIIAELESDGLIEDTFVFFFGDHGGVLPRSKGYLYETGLHVPLLVRIPENWKHLVPMPAGTRTKGFVSFVDLGPTLLHLANVPVPKHMDGTPFLGAHFASALESRTTTFGYADRFDEKYDFSRSLRVGDMKYIRHYQPFYPDALYNEYRFKMLAYQQWRQLYRDGKLNDFQNQFFRPKPVEALYDLASDPHEVQNLARNPRYAEVLKDLRRQLQGRMKSLPDLSLFPESYLLTHAIDNPISFGQQREHEIAALLDIADLSLLSFAEAKPKLEHALESANPWKRYWALIACSSFGQAADSLVPNAEACLKDANLLVRVRAAEFLAIARAKDPRPVLYEALNKTESPVEAMLILNTAAFFHDGFPVAFLFDSKLLNLKISGGQITRRLAYFNLR